MKKNMETIARAAYEAWTHPEIQIGKTLLWEELDWRVKNEWFRVAQAVLNAARAEGLIA